MDAGGGSGFESSPSVDCSKVDAQKTYKQIIDFKEAWLAKEALQEHRAAQLTKRFLKMREEDEREKLVREAERAQKEYNRSMMRLREMSEAEELLEQMAREEKSQIFQLMRDKGRQRAEEAAQDEANRQERQKWLRARQFHEQDVAEKRQEQLEKAQQEKMQTIEERRSRHQSILQEVESQRAEASKAELERRQAEAEKALARKTAAEKEMRKERLQKARSEQQRQQEAERRRQENAENVSRAVREASEKRRRKVQEAHQQLEAEFHAKHERLRAETQEAVSSKGSRDRALQADRLPVKVSTESSVPEASARREQSHVQESPRKSERQAPATSSALTSWSKELIAANDTAKKEYVQKSAELRQASFHMLTKKKFKSLAAAARRADDSTDIGATRMRSLHNMYINKKPTSPRQSSAARGSISAVESLPRPLRKQQCALCEREFPADRLDNKVMQKTVQKLKLAGKGSKAPPERSSGPPKSARASLIAAQAQDPPPSGGGASSSTGPSGSAGLPPPAVPAAPTDRAQGSQAPAAAAAAAPASSAAPASGAAEAQAPSVPEPRPSARGKASQLYDFEVPVCLACYHFIRVAST